MTPYKKAIDEWVASDQFKKASDPRTLKAPADQRQYLENRLMRAFDAGWSAGLQQAESSVPNGGSDRAG